MSTTSTHARVAAPALALLLALAPLSACGGSAEPSPAPEQAATPAEAQQHASASAPAEPETEPEPAEPEPILPELADSWYGIDQLFGVDGWTVTFAAEVTNPDADHYWTSVPVKATIYDASGAEIQTTSESVRVLEPGGSWAVMGVANCDTEPASVELALDTTYLDPDYLAFTPSLEAPDTFISSADLEVSDVVIGETEYAGVTCSLAFKVTNLSDRTADTVRSTILFKKGGKIVGTGSTSTWDVAPGTTADVDAIVDLVDYDDYVLYLNGEAAA